MSLQDYPSTMNHGKSEKGQSMMEFAISLVILLILLAGIVDLGRAIIAYFILQDAAEEGMVYGTSFPTDCNQINIRIRDNIESAFIDESTTISIDILNDSGGYTSCFSIPSNQVYAGKVLRISITNDFPITMPFLGAILNSQTVPLRIKANGIILRPQPPG